MNEINGVGGEQLCGLKPGEAVIIRDGPFAGQQAIFNARISGDERVPFCSNSCAGGRCR